MSLSLLPLASLTCSISWIVEETSVRGGGRLIVLGNVIMRKRGKVLTLSPIVTKQNQWGELISKISKHRFLGNC